MKDYSKNCKTINFINLDNNFNTKLSVSGQINQASGVLIQNVEHGKQRSQRSHKANLSKITVIFV